MRIILFVGMLCLAGGVIAQNKLSPIKADIYSWNGSSVKKNEQSEQRPLVEGSSVAFSHIKIHATTLYPGKSPHPGHNHPDEELIIVKEGTLTVTIDGKAHTLGSGSVALIMPGDEHSFENKSTANVTYYVMRYESRAPVNIERGKKAGGSFVIHWGDVAYQTHDKGGIRRFFDKPTAMCSRFEMHITTLKEGLHSHPPHTHKAAEILLPLDNITEEYIDGQWIKAGEGDIIFLESNVPHAIKNTGKGTVTYFAFQFE